MVKPLIFGEATRVMSLRDGKAKMSKSDPSDASRINLDDDADAISKKIRRARTDSEPLPGEPEGLDGRPEAANLVGIFAALSDRKAEDVLADFSGKGCADFKIALSDLAGEKLGPVGAEMKRLVADPAYIDTVLAQGAEKARAVAGPILQEVHEIIGLHSS